LLLLPEWPVLTAAIAHVAAHADVATAAEAAAATAGAHASKTIATSHPFNCACHETHLTSMADL